jgi:periplasmic protein TonB
VSESKIPLMASLGALPSSGSGEPLSLTMRRGVLALVIFFHVGGGWALTQVEPAKMIVGEIPALEVRTVTADTPAAPEEQKEEEPPPPDPPLAEEPPPPEIPITDLASVLDPPPPDLPPPAFPIEAKPPPPQPPKPPPPKPVQKAVPVPVAPVAQAPAVAPTPKVVSAAQLGWLIPPNPVFPGSARRANQQGTTMVRMLVDIAGRPSQVSVDKSSGFPDMDASALSAVRAAQLRPYSEGGTAQAVWVIVPIRFVLQ